MSGVKENSTTTAASTSTKQATQASSQSTPNPSGQPGSGSSGAQERVLITGDDILIEYVERLMNEIKNVNDNDLKASWKN